MKLKLYRLVTEHGDEIFVVAPSSGKTVEIYVAHELGGDRQVPDFDFERIDDKLSGERRVGLDDMLENGFTGLAVFDPLFGWVVGQLV